ncbi:Gag-pol polyprotein [Gregarina niphandrodes]|uniref:Gag-pol polyprotein n=1 Tax=Gregarina niphandrodes TaxID=110365 RepID=A0A023B2I0_GRENI|nr:Gag-pol polyprotein [Gregarina niphandrodes]EZG54628.1 Gag-pol polyprotein [Gregarina niphandrodes]|eukprot:XP_011131834.1 Gag-pol polyprotein [Gregarina niphandrodes]
MRVEAPCNVRELRSFLGSVTYLKRHIPQFASRVAGMTDLLKKKTEFVWSEAREEEFQGIKKSVAECVLLAAPADIGEFVLTTDASYRAIGAMPEQRQVRGCVPIEFGSKKLDECQQRWDTRERELYGVRFFVERWQDYFCAAPFTITTDHQNLLYLANSTKGKLARWSLFLQLFDFKIEYLKGTENVVADWLSRANLREDVG